MKFLILAETADTLALRVGAWLRREHGAAALGVISPETLALAPRFVYRQAPGEFSPELHIEFEIELASGVQLCTGELGAVFNRLRPPDPPQFRGASPADRQYASAELSALWVSWLEALQSQGTLVVNPPARGALQPAYSRLEWLGLACRAGLPVAAAALGEAERLVRPGDPTMERWLAAGKRFVHLNEPGVPAPDQTILPSAWAEGGLGGLARLQALSNCPLVELSLVDGAIAAIDPFPQASDPLAAAAIAGLLVEGAP
jgi:hypothetical protein